MNRLFIARAAAPVNARIVSGLAMDLQIPTPGEVLGQLFVYVVPAILILFFVRRVVVTLGVGWKRGVLGILSFALVAWVSLVAFAFIYPHNHHYTTWIESRPELSYWVDVLIGLLLVTLLGVAFFGPRRSERMPANQGVAPDAATRDTGS